MSGHTERDFETAIEAGLTGAAATPRASQGPMTRRWRSFPRT